ncbi:MAG: hypothetical protein PW843_07160 [Azospirillaceae bacterium]|nr:hypothetical protein [Azospirillaceae bacterium]
MVTESVGKSEDASSAPLWGVAINGGAASSGNIIIGAAGTLSINFESGGNGSTLQINHGNIVVEKISLGTAVKVPVYAGYTIAYATSGGDILFAYSLETSS